MSVKTYDINIINELIKYATKNKKYNKFTHAAAIGNKGKILYKDINCYEKTTPLTYQDISQAVITKHAEIGVLKWLLNSRKRSYKNITVYVTGLSKANSITLARNSKPCYRCEKVIKDLGISRVIYTTSLSNEFKIIEQLYES